ncbi:MAG: hypothetical protein Q7O66_20865 [Dehalococcoidia bacterium]|nr:hypothetical protein [Dehalococcoidia bacterium]
MERKVEVDALDLDAARSGPDSGFFGPAVPIDVPRAWAVAWRSDGKRVAFVRSVRRDNTDADLILADKDGNLLWRTTVSSDGAYVGEPQWTPDGRWIFVPTFPRGGRRIIAVEAGTGRAFDLSQYRWDAYFSLSPSGHELLLSNGRGGYWKATLDFE